MTQQPEALRLADRLDLYATGDPHQQDIEQAADELRRLHEVEVAYGVMMAQAESRIAEHEQALRERLAQPQRTHWDGCDEVHPECRKPEQEPVAWVNQANLNSAAIQRNRCGQGDTHTWSETPTWDYSVPLYTAPPQRQPLTDEQLLEILGDIDADTKRLPPGIKAFARAIEAAHGIKGNI